MKAIFVVALLLVPAVLATAEFDAFLSQHGKHYTGAEYARRLAIFERNVRIASQFQKEERGSAKYGVTQFFDMTYEEWASKYLMAPKPGADLARNCLKNGVYNPAPQNVRDVPTSFDWRDHPGMVQPVKDQASCGSCWAFSAAGALEGAWVLAGNTPANFSTQWIVDCSKGCTSEIYLGKNVTVCNQGCSGGWPWSAFYDIIAQKGDPDYESYPYRGVNQACKGNDNHKVLGTMTNYTCVSGPDAADEVAMQVALMTYGPLSIAVDANYFNSYHSGIMNPSGCSKTVLNHAILLVGWGVEGNTPYWIIKNSWGVSWGEKGYVRLFRGSGVCGVNLGVTAVNI